MSTPSGANLRAMAGSPELFRAHLLIDVDGQALPFGEVASDLQRADFAAADPAWRRLADPSAPEPEHRRFYLERGRGGSKTTDLGTMATWALAFARRRLRLVAAASDQDQARLLRDAIDGLLALNPWLRGLLSADRNRVGNDRTGSTLEVLSADVGSSYGLSPDAVLIDELTHWRDGGEALWHSLFSGASKRKNALVCIISNAGFGKGESWQWKVRESARTSARWYFHQWPGPAEWMDAATLHEMKETLPPLVFARLFENQWTSGEGDALDSSWVDRAIVLPGPASGREEGWLYGAGLDLSLRSDWSALAIVAKHVGGSRRVAEGQEPRVVSRLSRILQDIGQSLFDGDEDGPPMPRSAPVKYEHVSGSGKVKLVALHVWKPLQGREVDLGEIERVVLEQHTRFGLARLCFDEWQSASLRQRLSKRGLIVDGVSFTGSALEDMAAEIIQGFREDRIQLYPEPSLIGDLRNLRLVERSYGVRLESPRARGQGHGDAATSFALALLGLKRSKRRVTPTVNRPLHFG